jgi:DNA-directed RNA polymerase subunit beta'
LTMRTFHTGGVAGIDITSGLPRVEELFEARVPKGAALLADIDGVVEIENDGEGRRLRVVSREELREDYPLPEGAQLLVDEGEYVEPGMILARMMTPLTSGNGASEPEEPHQSEEVIANIGGRVELSSEGISIVWEDVEEREHIIPASAYIQVSHGDQIKAGDALTGGPLNPHDILHIRGKDELQRYLVDEVQQVYRSQGVSIHDKHIEVILRQMLRRVQVESTGDSDFIPGQMVDKFEFQEKNAKVLAEGGEPATAKPVLLGVTRASLLTDSFLAAASFQETTRVLTQAAVSGAHDWLLGLKENVIIGRLIPARLESLSVLEEPEPETLPLREMEDMVPAGWLDIANEATSQYAIGMEGQRPQDRPFLYTEEDNLMGDSDDDDEDDHLLNGKDALFGEENGSEGNGFSALSAFEDEDTENE